MSDHAANSGHQADDDLNVPFDEAEFDSLRDELSPMVNDYRENVLEKIEPSAEYRASMHKLMLGLVRDDVLEIHKEAALSTKLAGRFERWMACWRELVETSILFRLGTQGAFALGLGLLLTMAWVSAMDKEPVAARTIIEEEQELVPEKVWQVQMTDEKIQPPSPLGDLPKEPGTKSKRNK